MHPIDCLDAQLLKLACPENSVAVLVAWTDPIKLGCQRFGIDTPREISALLAQAGHESAGFTQLSENLNYSAHGLANTWPGRYAVNPRAPVKTPNTLALQIQRNPQMIANVTYANRYGNGPASSGDGWRYRGFGPFQLTFKANHEAFGNAVGISVEQVPDYIRTTNGGAMSMCWFFKAHNLSNLAETAGCADETKAVNGGEIGLADRTARFERVLGEINRRLGL